jgi:hypothetical protein
MAFKDGVFGQQLDETMPGPLAAHRDGSLGQLRRRTRGTRGVGEYFPGAGAPVAQAYKDGSLGSLGDMYVNGQRVDSPITITESNSLGPGGQNGGADVTDGGTLGPGASQLPGASGFEEDPGLLNAWQDGVLGNPPYSESMPGPLRAQNQGIVGDPPYDHAPGYVWPTVPVSGLGVVGGTSPAQLDLKDPATVREVKMTLAYLWGEALSQDNQRIWDQEFYESAIWGPKASDLTDRWAQMVLSHPDTGPEATRGTLVVETPRGTYPTLGGMMWCALMLEAASQMDNPLDFQGGFPILYAWLQTIKGDPEAATLVPPYFSESDRVAAANGIKMSTVALVGLGAVGLIGAAIVLGGRKKKPR